MGTVNDGLGDALEVRKRRAVAPCFPGAARSSASEGGGVAMIGGIAAVIVVIVVQRRKGKVDRSTESAQKRHEKESVAFENPLYSTKDVGEPAGSPPTMVWMMGSTTT